MIQIRRAVILLVFLSFPVTPMFGQLELPRPSPKATVSQRVGLTDVEISYSRPGVKGRTIWGGLVPYDKIWRTGANEATTISFTDPVKVNGQPLPAGRYALFTIPGKEEWTVLFNTNPDQDGTADYDAAKDVLTLKVRPQAMSQSLELMTFSFPIVSADSAVVTLAWEKLQLPLVIGTDTPAKVHSAAKKAMSSLEPSDWRTPFRAANYAYSAGLGWPEAGAWIDKSIAVSPNYSNLSLKARMLADSGMKAEAIATAQRAVTLGKAADPPVDTTATETLLAEWKK